MKQGLWEAESPTGRYKLEEDLEWNGFQCISEWNPVACRDPFVSPPRDVSTETYMDCEPGDD